MERCMEIKSCEKQIPFCFHNFKRQELETVDNQPLFIRLILCTTPVDFYKTEKQKYDDDADEIFESYA